MATETAAPAAASSASAAATAAAPAPGGAAPAAAAPAAKPVLDLKLGGDGKETPAAAPAPVVPDAELVKQLAKASAGERKALALVAETTKKLEAATGGASEAQKKAAMWDAVTKDPSLLLEHGVTWDQVLAAVAGKKVEPPDPRQKAVDDELAALRKRNEDRDKADADAKTAAEKAREEEVKANDLKKVNGIIETDGKKPDKDGFPRWAVVSQDATAAQTAIDAVLTHITDNKVECSHEEALELVRQALDQMEAHERKKFEPLKGAREKVGSGEGPSQPKVRPREQLTPAEKSDAPKDNPISRQRPRVRAANF